jgi:hypothetical protein
MSRLTWEDRGYSLGVDRGVYFGPSGVGEPWNGLKAVVENESDSNETPRFFDGVKIDTRRSIGYFNGTIQAYHYPEGFYDNVMLRVRPKSFGLSYREGDFGNQKIHLVYNVTVKESGYQYRQIDPDLWNWDFSTLPIPVPGVQRAAHIVVDTTLAYSSTVAALEDVLYGTEAADSRLPSPEEVLDIFESHSILTVTDHGDGTYTIDGPDSAVIDNGDGTFEVSWASVVILSADAFRISSL